MSDAQCKNDALNDIFDALGKTDPGERFVVLAVAVGIFLHHNKIEPKHGLKRIYGVIGDLAYDDETGRISTKQ